jgi:hypothetical protein
MIRKSVLSVLHIMIAGCCMGQVLLPVPANLQKTFTKGTRTITGEPGKKYWQNRADYNINVSFDPESRMLDGSVMIDYTNNSPDTLKEIVFKLYPNLYKRESPRLMRADSMDLTTGVQIQSIEVNGVAIQKKDWRIDATNMSLKISPQLPGDHDVFIIHYSYKLNKHSHMRTGEIDPGADFVAYFFPRIAVYDDIDGWNRIPYLGNLEFYNDFCRFNVLISVPSTQVIWATGNLVNGKDVLSAPVYERLQEAEKNDAITTLIDSTELHTATSHTNPTNTWHFTADSVTDFVFACSDHYMWKSTSLVVDPKTGRRTRVDAAFNPKHLDYFPVIDDARKTVQAMSYNFPKWPYPYAHETVFDGLDQMEYPMMVNDNPLQDRADEIELTDHEIFHTMFPFYMGINETKYAWMDEGWATIGEWLISPMIDSSLVDEYGVGAVANQSGTERDVPIMALSTEQNQSYFINAYPKPAMGYLFVKDLLGDELFYKGLHYYFKQWSGKHPMPFDFFNCMNTGSGKNLNWFWKKWFFETGVTDMAISAVKVNSTGATVTVSMKGTKPLPVDLTIESKDGTKIKVHRNVGVWEKGNMILTIPVKAKNIVKISLGDPHTPDANKKDNEWTSHK